MGKLVIIIGMIISIAAASGPVFGGLLNEAFGFKSILYVNIPFILIALVLGNRYVKECYDKTLKNKVDVVGSILLAYGLGAFTFLLVKGNDYGWSSLKILFLIVSSLISISTFLIYERKIQNSMIDFSLFNVRSFTASIILISVIFFAYMPIAYLMNFYLENQLGYTVLKSGLIIGITSATAFFMSPMFGLISKKISIKVVSFLAITFVTLGDLMFVFMSSENHMKIIYCAFILVGMGIGATSPLYQSAFEEISQDKNGIASGILNSLRQLTACVAIALVATLSSHYGNMAVDNTKSKVINEVRENTKLDQSVKDTIIEGVKGAKTNETSGFSKETIHNTLKLQEGIVLTKVSSNMKPVVEKKFNTEEKEIYNIIDDLKTIKEDESNKVYNKCFLIFGLIAVFGIIAVPFNSKKALVK